MLCFDVVFLRRMVAMETWREGFQKMEKILQAVAVCEFLLFLLCEKNIQYQTSIEPHFVH